MPPLRKFTILENANYELIKMSGVPFERYDTLSDNNSQASFVVANPHWVKRIPFGDAVRLDKFQLGSADDYGTFIADRQTLPLPQGSAHIFITFSRYQGTGYFGVVTFNNDEGYKSKKATFQGKYALDDLKDFIMTTFDLWVDRGVTQMLVEHFIEPETGKKKSKSQQNNEMDLIDIEE